MALSLKKTRGDGRMSGASVSRSGRLANPNAAGSNPDLVGLNPGQVKQMTLKLIIVAS